MSALAKGLCEALKESELLRADDRATQRDIDEEIKAIVTSVLDAAALEEACGAEPGDDLTEFEGDMSDPDMARMYVMSLSKELVSIRTRHDHLRELIKTREADHARVLIIQAEQHAREIAALADTQQKHAHEHNGRTYSFYGGCCPVCGKS